MWVFLVLLLSLGLVLLTRCVMDGGEDDDGDGDVVIPANVSASALGPDSIRVSWSGVNGAERYNIYRSTSSTGTFEGLFYVIETNFTDTELSPNTTYYYKVSAVKGAKESLQSTAASAKTFTNNTEQIPAPPLGLNAVSLSSDSIVVSWNPVGNALSYRLYRKNSAGSFDLLATPSSTSYTDTGLTPSTPYYYKVSAANSSGESSQSGETIAMTFAAGSVSAPSSAPGGLNATAATGNTITLGWDSLAGVSAYIVYRGSSISGPWEIRGTPGSTTYTDSGLNPGAVYYYKVSGVNSGGEGPQSTVYSASTQGAGGELPSAPASVSAAALSSSVIELSWATVSGAVSYRVYRSTDAANYTLIGFPTGTSYTDGGLSASTTYHYKVSAVNAKGEGPQSQIASAVTSGGGGYPPQAPAGLKISSPSSSGIGISWTSTSGASSYKVYRANSSSGSYGLIGTTGSVSYTDTSVTGGASYYYRVSAVNANGESSRSASAFGFAASYYELSYHTGKQVMNMTSGGKHYYRLAVSSGTSYTIEWQTGYYNDGSTVTSASGAASHVVVNAWQNDGTTVFTNQYNGFTSPKTFTAASSGYVTVEVKQEGSHTGTYAVYYY
jgi:fibronectin type 3 domain-containing protein